MRFFCIGFRCGNNVAICINLYLPGCIIHFRKYGLPYGLSVSLCTLHLMVTHFDATLGMGGWLDLTQQGLSPCKKYRASWRSSAKRYRIIDLAQRPLFFFQSHSYGGSLPYYAGTPPDVFRRLQIIYLFQSLLLVHKSLLTSQSLLRNASSCVEILSL